MVPDSAVVRAPIPGSNARAHRERREVPSTNWVAFTARAKSSSAAGTSSPTTVWNDAPTSSARRRSSTPVLPGSRGPVSPSLRRTCTHSRSADPARRAMRAARRMTVALSGPPVTATTTRSRASHDLRDRLLAAVALQGDVDLVGDPQQRELAQRDEVARCGSSARARRRSSPAGRCCRAPCAGAGPSGVMSTSSIWSAARTTASGIVSRWRTPVMRSTTSLSDSRCCTLTVVMHVDPGGEELLDVLPALGVARAGRVGVRQLVDHAHLGCPGEHRVDVELGEPVPRWSSDRAGQHLEALEQLGGPGPAVGLDEPDDDVGARARGRRRASFSIGVGLADAGRRAEVDPQFTAAR